MLNSRVTVLVIKFLWKILYAYLVGPRISQNLFFIRLNGKDDPQLNTIFNLLSKKYLRQSNVYRVKQYIKVRYNLVIHFLCIDNMTISYLWISAEFASHNDSKVSKFSKFWRLVILQIFMCPLQILATSCFAQLKTTHRLEYCRSRRTR